MSKFTLDFTIQSSKDRLEAIKDIPLETLNKSELETISNYILYGKDDDGTSVVDRKEVFIKTKFNSYQKDKTVSLEGLMESPTFDEKIFQKNRTIYKKEKPTIKREELKDIPDLVQLWEEIDKLQGILDQNEGKVPLEEGTPKLSKNQIYYLKHNLIDLRTQQYQILDCFRPTIGQHQNKAEFYTSQSETHTTYPIYPRGLITSPTDLFFLNPRSFSVNSDLKLKERCAAEANFTYSKFLETQNGGQSKPYFNFCDFNHVYQLILHYGDLKNQSRNYPDSLIHNLLSTLDFYIEKANLSNQQKLIVEDKKLRIPNKDIRLHLIQELGIDHKENYISTIWNKAVKLIVEAVELNLDEFLCMDYEKAWKKCNRCGEILLRDPRNFVRKTKSADGLTGRCKKCDRELRQGGK